VTSPPEPTAADERLATSVVGLATIDDGPAPAPASEETADATGLEVWPSIDVGDVRGGRWGILDRAFSTPLLLIGADVLVLAGYVLLAPDWWRALTALWLGTVVVYYADGAYRLRLHLSVLDDLPALARRSCLLIAVMGVIEARIRGAANVDKFVVIACAGFAGHLITRALAYTVIRWARRTNRSGLRTLIVGGGNLSTTMASLLREHPEYGLRVIGYIDEKRSRLASWSPGERYLGTIRSLPVLIDQLGIRTVLIGFGIGRDVEAVNALRSIGRRRLTTFLIPRMFEIGRPRSLQDHIGGIPIIFLRRTKLCGPRWRLKRAFDLVVAATALIVLSPLLLFIAAAVRMESGPGVLFRQTRVGQHGRRFTLLKFRSMQPADADEPDVRWSIARDDRVGPVGRFIRRTSLDELPQLINILRGDMTIVGPRPERPYYVDLFSSDLPHYPYRHRAPVGLTGLAQVSGLRGDTSIDERARYDNYYIENWSIWLDTKIILRTVREVFHASGG
jgi:exopolysaccharide biosynthesis polyprenyl glycosylphosphotransferase